MKMPPNHFMFNGIPVEPVSRTYQYRKIMKPMLERKRRARINKCLDELKDLMTGTLKADGENVSKLEKADILELTVRHLHRLRESNALFPSRRNELINMDKFWAGFQHCAAEVSQFLNNYDQNINYDLIKYIANYIPNIATQAAVAAANVASASTNTTAATAATSHINLATLSQKRLKNTVLNQCPPFNRSTLITQDDGIVMHVNRRKNGQNTLTQKNAVESDEMGSDGESSNADTVCVWRPW